MDKHHDILTTEQDIPTITVKGLNWVRVPISFSRIRLCSNAAACSIFFGMMYPAACAADYVTPASVTCTPDRALYLLPFEEIPSREVVGSAASASKWGGSCGDAADVRSLTDQVFR
ncbi:hypothetical protein B0H19DRAFT_1079725 [Mycena capillaripes]|nr:hypothetical protein B0H19DRAFT_1079725 [Mycena capillaripes]